MSKGSEIPTSSRKGIHKLPNPKVQRRQQLRKGLDARAAKGNDRRLVEPKLPGEKVDFYSYVYDSRNSTSSRTVLETLSDTGLMACYGERVQRLALFFEQNVLFKSVTGPAGKNERVPSGKKLEDLSDGTH